VKVVLDDRVGATQPRDCELMALDQALVELARIDPRQGQIMELRYFGGLSEQEVAAVLSISRATVTREWLRAGVALSSDDNRTRPGNLMTREAGRWARVKQAVQDALDPTPDERSAVFRETCGNDRNLRAESTRCSSRTTKPGSLRSGRH
jgi:hypothetical protein